MGLSHAPRMLCPIVLLLVCVGCGNGDATLTSGAGSATPSRTLPTASTSASAAPSVSAVRVTAMPSARSPSPTRTKSPTPRPPSPSPNVVTLTEASSGQTVRLHIGQSVDVELPGGGSGGYTQPTSSDDTVIHRVSSSGGYPTSQPARGRFIATAPGRSDLGATTDFTCLHTNPPCLPPQRQWTVHIVVSA